MPEDPAQATSSNDLTTQYAKLGTSVELHGLNDASSRMRSRLAGNLGAGH